MLKPVQGFEGLYSVDELGNVWSIYQGGKARMKPQRGRQGYMHVGLSKDCKVYTRYVHRLVAQAFVPNPNPKNNTVNHKNGIKPDNSASNLEWITRQGNSRHAWRTGLITAAMLPRGSAHKKSKLTEEKVAAIRADVKSTAKELASRYGVSAITIYKIRDGSTWTHVDKPLV